MAEWQEPVFDRTQADVEYAAKQLAQGINNVEYKGCFNQSDINRIENNTRYLADMLNDLYYSNSLTTKNDWDKSSTITMIYITRIITNINTLWSAYYKPTGAIGLPYTLLTFEQVNDIEKNLYLIKNLLDNMVASFRECGTFNCGEE